MIKRKEKEEKKTPVIRYTYTNKVHHSCQLLEYLLQKLPESRNTVKALLSSNKVLVNGTVVRQFNYPLAKDDEVKIAKNPVVTKQVGKKKKEETKKFNIKPYIVYDDKETSGVLVFAKDIKIHSMLKGHWNDDVSNREYIAIINGKLDNPSGTIKNYLRENKNNMVYVSNSGKLAITHYKTLNKNKDYSLLQVNIDSGRKNQIRVAMANLNHPIIGDDKYGDGISPINRLGLHASILSFINPITSELIEIKAPIPKEFKELFK